MHVEAYDLDSLRGVVRELLKENRQLRAMLREKGVVTKEEELLQEEEEREECFPDQGERILPYEINREAAKYFFSRFWGRTDVYARRGKNGGYFPQCQNRWNDLCPKQRGEKLACEDCEHRKWTSLTPEAVMNHLRGSREDGSDAIGVYPLLPDNTCRFLVFDFDNHEKGAEKEDFANADEVWKDEVDALRRICELHQIPALVERSRSGRGAHVWIFFSEPVKAAFARNFGFMLLEKGSASINLPSFRYYDRMYPSQDVLSTLGNLIALPLQGQPLRKGNSAFVDEDWNAFPDQMGTLLGAKRLSMRELGDITLGWAMEKTGVLPGEQLLLGKEREKPWRKKEGFVRADVTGVLHLVLSDGLYVDALNVNPRLQNQLRCLATMDNPQFYKNKNSGRSNYYTFQTIYLGRDVDGYIRLPRGLLEVVKEKCEEAKIPYEVEDHRTTGRPIRVRFKGTLTEPQTKAVESMLSFETGILSSATGSGKTVDCAYFIAHRKVSTLILVEKKELLIQWQERLEQFLEFDEPLPTYTTPKGRVKTRESVVGLLGGGCDTTAGIVDIAMVPSAGKNEDFLEKLDRYGMVIMDECHHGASARAQLILERVSSKYVYGVSATPKRSDDLEKIVFMLLGPVRHVYSAKQLGQELGMVWYVIPRFTRAVSWENGDPGYQEALELICESRDRNEQILQDVKKALSLGKTPLVLTGRKKHAKLLYEALKGEADHVFLRYGDNSAKENKEIRRQMEAVGEEESLLLVATGQMVGEGYDFPRFDTLFLTTPVKFDGLLTQYVGRLIRRYEGKKEVYVYDYVDGHIPVLQRQHKTRLRAYRKMGYRILSDLTEMKQKAGVLYGSRDYLEVFERDLIEAEGEVVIASPELSPEKVARLVDLMKPRMEAGVKVCVVTRHPDTIPFGDSAGAWELIRSLKEAGVWVRTAGEETERFAVMGKDLFWYGYVSFLGQEDSWESLLRVTSSEAAAELLQKAHGTLVGEGISEEG